MNLSGILVVAGAGRFDACLAAVSMLPGVEVFHPDRASGRFVAVQEAASVDEEVAGLSRIKAVPGVALAEMVCHYFPDGETP